MYFNYTTTAQIAVTGITAPELTINGMGGTVSVYEGIHGNRLPEKVSITAHGMMVKVMAHTQNIRARMSKYPTDNSMMAAVDIEPEAVGENKLDGGHLLSVGKTNSSDITHLSVDGDSSTVYIVAANQQHLLATSNKELKVVHGKAQNGPATVLPEGVEVLNKLVRWLKTRRDAATQKFIVYIQLLAPGAPVGTLRILSTSCYEALSLSFFTTISGGMMSPETVRIQLPVTTPPFIFPNTARGGRLSKDEQAEWSSSSSTRSRLTSSCRTSACRTPCGCGIQSAQMFSSSTASQNGRTRHPFGSDGSSRFSTPGNSSSRL
jgi:hypothetical protein